MPTYDYQAYDTGGKLTYGVASADSDRLLRRKLRERGLFVTEVKAVRAPASTTMNSYFSDRLKRNLNAGELALIFRQLGTLVASGLPLDESLQLMSDQSDSRRQQRAVENWRSQLVEGKSFAKALADSIYKVPDQVVASIAISEETGHLAQVIQRLADELEVSLNNRRQLIKGLIYPAVMVFVALAVIGIMLTYVVPQVTRVFVNTGTELPALTRVMIGVSEFVSAWGSTVLALLGLTLVIVLVALRRPDIRLIWDRKLISLPLIGNWIRMANFGDWSRNLGLLLGSGVPALSALQIASTSLGNHWYRERMQGVTESVRGGSSLHSALRKEDFAPAFVLHMVGSGEASSELAPMLIRVSDYYRMRLDSSIDTALKLMEPALILTMGLFVMLIVGAVLVPIVQMNQLI